MIRIHRGNSPPALAGKTQEATLKLCEKYQAGERTFTFQNKIYAAPEVKAALKVAQHLKCCFCERTVGEDGHIEHFRPKGGVRQDSGSPLSECGYYWLAYEWTNLLLSCADCNVRHKANLFPLAAGTRAESHHESIEMEHPPFINPADEDPEELIEWHDEIPKAVDGNIRADVTLRALRLGTLDRDGLVESRRQHLAIVKSLVDSLIVIRARATTPDTISLIEDLDKKIRKAAGPAGKYCAMIRAMLRARAVQF